MSDKRKGRSSALVDQESGTGAKLLGLEELAKAGYKMRLRDGEAYPVVQLDIFEIVPDFTQPRRSLPSFVREHWNGSPLELKQALAYWWQTANEERGTELDLRALLFEDNRENAQETAAAGVIEAGFLALVELAASVRREGLTNPITVVKEDEYYRLETGERRWLAFHLLHWFDASEKWKFIPVRIVEEFNVWRQATENAARQDLNAVGRARQYAVLLMDLWQRDEKYPREFNAYPECETDQQFYAQVVGLRPPRGKGDLLLQAMGMTNRPSLNDYRRILEVPYPLWVQADDESWSLRQLVGGETFGAPNVSQIPNQEVGKSDAPTLSPEKQGKLSFVEKLAISASKSRKIAQRAAQKANRAGGETKAQIRNIADEQIEWWRKFRESLDL